jgi:hypothetical protein
MRFKMQIAYATPETSIPINTIGVETPTGNKFTGTGSIPTVEFSFEEMTANTTWFFLYDSTYHVRNIRLSRQEGTNATYCFDIIGSINPSLFPGLATAIETYLNPGT